MTIKVKLFAMLRTQVGKKEMEIDISDQTIVRDIIKKLSLHNSNQLIILINGVHCNPDHRLTNGDVVSIFPMIAGG